MDAFAQSLRRKEHEFARHLGAFAPAPSGLRLLADHAELERLRAGGVGFIVNVREGYAKVHRVRCSYVETMFATKYPKFFSADATAVLRWLSSSPRGSWDACGVCGGTRGAPA